MEILFRGKRIDTGEWVYGDFYRKCGITGLVLDYMISARDGMAYPVIPETVGQYTGHDDKNGNRIFDGDVVAVDHDFIETHSRGNVEDGTLEVFNEYYGGIHEIGEVKFERAAFVVQEWDLGIFEDSEIEVIENIHDNPELMEVKE
ncbi:YopX family protein [Clostridiaceae bacterium HFYG-1003]|nr:YopX family protein [Clostridiaceae bacterium HFYG-1003]